MYEVTPTPIDAKVATLGIEPEILYAYPNAEQTSEQQAQDQDACHSWAVQQSGFNPHKPPDQTSQQGLPDYNRAFRACMQARNYTVQ